MYGIVYHLFCTVTGKSYVGQTILSFDIRWNMHLRKSRKMNWPISRAIRKYGPFAFAKSILGAYSSKDELDEAEIYWGEFFNCLTPNGYNLRIGDGKGKWSQEVKEKIGLL